MRSTYLLGAMLILAVTLAGCGSNKIEDPSDKDPTEKDASFVYGFLDLTEASGTLQGVFYRQVSPVTEKPVWSFGVQEGAFFNQYVNPGSYFMQEFHVAGGFMSNDSIGRIPRQAKDFQLKVEKPRSFIFVGSYRYKKVPTGFFEQSKFGLERADKPTEKEVLTMLLPLMQGTKLEQRTQEYLKRLK